MTWTEIITPLNMGANRLDLGPNHGVSGLGFVFIDPDLDLTGNLSVVYPFGSF